MRLVELVEKIKKTCVSIRGVNSFNVGDVYDYWAKSNIKYISMNWDLTQIEPVENEVGELVRYHFVCYCGDRLVESEHNEFQIYDYSTYCVETALRTLGSMDGIMEIEKGVYVPFTQSFNDNLAGVYINVVISVESDLNNCNYTLNTDENEC